MRPLPLVLALLLTAATARAEPSTPLPSLQRGPEAQALRQIEAEARARWPLLDCLVIHRYGRLEPGAQIMMVATAAAHRQAAFEAADFLMDYLKSRAPFWKKEHGAAGAGWVSARDSDEAALERWSGRRAPTEQE